MNFLVSTTLHVQNKFSSSPRSVANYTAMSKTRSLVASSSDTFSPISETFVHSIHGAGRFLPSASRWNSIEFTFTLLPSSASFQDITPSKFTKSVDFNLVVTDKACLKRFLAILLTLIFIPLIIFFVLRFLPHHNPHAGPSKNLTLALNQALLFFDAQKSGFLPNDNGIDFRGNSGLHDGNWSDKHADLVGGFYDSGANVKYTFPTAYALTMLSWSVIEYMQQYDAIAELDHIRSIIRWGTDYLLKVFVPFNSTTNQPAIIYSQVGDASSGNGESNDKSCWQRPEDMDYPRPVSACTSSASDLAGEIIAALSSASLVFKEDEAYSHLLTSTAVKLYQDANSPGSTAKEDYTQVNDCGVLARNYYNSSGYLDELVWGGAWLFLATGNLTYLRNATDSFDAAVLAEPALDSGVLDWNNKLTAVLILFSRFRFFHDLGYPYEAALRASSDKANNLMCSYLYPRHGNFNVTPGGLILLRPNASAPLQYAASAAFLAKIYKDYLSSVGTLGVSCSNIAESFSLDMLHTFSMYQVEYILGKNPMKMSYLVGFEGNYPTQVHHRGASIPNDGQRHSCADGKRWLLSKDGNPNILRGAMVGGPNNDDTFLDRRDEPQYTEPTLAGNAGLVAAIVALHASNYKDLDTTGIFANVDPDDSNSTP